MLKNQKELTPGTSWSRLLSTLRTFYGWMPIMLRQELRDLKQAKDEPVRAYVARLMVMRNDAAADDQLVRDALIRNINQATRDALERRLDAFYPPEDGDAPCIDKVPLEVVLRLL